MNSFNCYSCQKVQKWCLRLLCNTVYRVMLLILLMLKGLKVYSVYRASLPSKDEGYLKSLPSCGFSYSPPVSPRRQTLLTFLDLSTTRVIAGKMHSQSPILKTKGVLSNLVILTYLWEQSFILHTLTKLPACNLTKKHLQCLKKVAGYNSFGGGRVSFWQSWLT